MESDKDLIIKYLAGDEQSFETLVNRHIKHTYNFIIRYGGNSAVADDLLQETFLRAWKNLRHFDSEKKFVTWLLTIARNVVMDWHRKRKDVSFSLLDTEETEFSDTLISELPSPEEIFDQKFLKTKFDEEVSKLSPVEQTILLLHLEQELPFIEISEVISKPVNTVKSIYRRSLIKIKKNWIENQT